MPLLGTEPQFSIVVIIPTELSRLTEDIKQYKSDMKMSRGDSLASTVESIFLYLGVKTTVRSREIDIEGSTCLASKRVFMVQCLLWKKKKTLLGMARGNVVTQSVEFASSEKLITVIQVLSSC